MERFLRARGSPAIRNIVNLSETTAERRLMLQVNQEEMDAVSGVFSRSWFAGKWGNLCDLVSDALRQKTEEASFHMRQVAEHRWNLSLRQDIMENI